MDVLRALSSPNMDIRKKTLDIALDLITARNIDEVRCPPPTPQHGKQMHRVVSAWSDTCGMQLAAVGSTGRQ